MKRNTPQWCNIANRPLIQNVAVVMIPSLDPRWLSESPSSFPFLTTLKSRSLRVVSIQSDAGANVAVIIVRIVFIGSFFFDCLFSNHSFQTNPNKITNCFQLFSLLQLYNQGRTSRQNGVTDAILRCTPTISGGHGGSGSSKKKKRKGGKQQQTQPWGNSKTPPESYILNVRKKKIVIEKMNELLSSGMQLFKDRNIVPGKKRRQSMAFRKKKKKIWNLNKIGLYCSNKSLTFFLFFFFFFFFLSF